jgi:hypothetical protein
LHVDLLKRLTVASEKGNSNSQFILEAIYQAVFTAIAGLAQNAASPLTNLYVSLHTADPTAAGNQASNEAAYGSYARVAVARSTAGWSITSETISNVAAITFPTSSSGTETETYVGVGTAATGNGVLLWSGELTAPLAVGSAGITPLFAIGELEITEG